MWEPDEYEDDEEDERTELHVGGINQLTSVQGKKNKRRLGFAVSKEPDTKCKDHPAYTGVKQLKRSCPACRRLYNAKHSEITIQARPGFNPSRD